MLRLFPQIDIGPPRNGLPRAISGHTIFEASAQNRTPTSFHASAKKMRRRNFVSMLIVSFRPLLASGSALLTAPFKFGFIPCRYWINACHVRVDPPIATVELDFFPAGFVTVVLFRKLVHLDNHLFSATDVDHCLPEGFVADVSVVDAVVLLFTAFLCKLIRRKVIFTSRCFSIPVTVWSALSLCRSSGWRTNLAQLRCTFCFRQNHLS